MKVSAGIVCSVLGATIAFYLAIVSLVTLPADGAVRWIAIAGITALSLVAGLLINGMSMQDYFKVSRAYNTLTTRLSPLLYNGIEDVLQRRKTTYNPGGFLNFTVLAPIDGFYRVVGATCPAEHPMRQNSNKFGEGALGYLSERKVAGYTRPGGWAQSKEGTRTVFDRAGNVLGEVTFRPPSGVLNIDVEAKWIYFRPIFEKSAANPWSDRVVGFIHVQSSADDADNFFKTAEAQQQVDSIATEVSPYLDAIQVLTGEEKL